MSVAARTFPLGSAVDDHAARLERFEQRTEWPLAAVALLFLVLYSIRVLAEPVGGARAAVDYALWAMYFVFVVEYLGRLYLAKPRTRWFFRHIVDFLIVTLPSCARCGFSAWRWC